MANQAVVGILRTLLTADTAQYETGMKKAAQTATQTGKVIGAIGPQIAKTTPQMERMVKAFQGDKLLYQANNLVAAVTRVGGASRLTEAETRRVNAQLTTAIEKYRALGQQAPAAMLRLEQATRRADVTTTRFGSSLTQARTVAAAFGVTLGTTAVLNFGRQLLTMADELVKVADRTGLTTSEVQELQFVAQQSGNSIEEFTGAIGQLQNRLVTGDKSAIAAVKALNLNLADLKAQAPIEQLQSIARAIGEIPDPATRAAIAMDLFGRSGLAILPTLIADFERLRTEAPKMSDATVRALDEVGDQLGKFQLQVKVWAAEAFLFAGRLLDIYIMNFRRGQAAALEGLAVLVEVVQKIPGLLGLAARALNAEDLRKQATWFREAADATAQALNRVEPEVRKNTAATVDYAAILDRTAESSKKVTSATAALKGETTALIPILAEHFRWWKGMAPAIDDTRASMEAYHLIATSNIEDAFAWREAEKALNAELARKGMLLDFTDVTDNKASQEARDIAQERVDAQQEAVQQIRDQWAQAMRDIGQRLTMSISDALADSLVGLRSFKEAFVGIWESIRQAFSNILATMLDQFVNSFLKGMLNAVGASRLGEKLGGLLTGGGGIGGAVANVAGSAIPGGVLTGAASTGLTAGAAAGGTLASFGPSAGVLAAGTGVGAGTGAGTAGAVGAGIGTGATIGLTAGIGGGALLAWAIWKKGLFRGGEEATKVSPRRDKFQLQNFGQPGDTIATAGQRMAADLTRLTKQPGGGPLWTAFQRADTVKEYEPAQTAIVNVFAKAGRRLKVFHDGGVISDEGEKRAGAKPWHRMMASGERMIVALTGEAVLNRQTTTALGGKRGIDALNTTPIRHAVGGFIQKAIGTASGTALTRMPGLIMPQMPTFHDGGMVSPLLASAGAGTLSVPASVSPQTHIVKTVNLYINGVLDRDSVKQVMRDHVYPELNREMLLDQHGFRSSVKKVGIP